MLSHDRCDWRTATCVTSIDGHGISARQFAYILQAVAAAAAAATPIYSLFYRPTRMLCKKTRWRRNVQYKRAVNRCFADQTQQRARAISHTLTATEWQMAYQHSVCRSCGTVVLYRPAAVTLGFGCGQSYECCRALHVPHLVSVCVCVRAPDRASKRARCMSRERERAQ